MSTSKRFQRHNSTLIWTILVTISTMTCIACSQTTVAYAEPATTRCTECLAIQSQLEIEYAIRFEGPWQADELHLLQSALRKAAQLTNSRSGFYQALEDAKLNEGNSADYLYLVRQHEGRASYQQGSGIFRILIGDEVFAYENYKQVPVDSRPQALGLRTEATSAEMSMLHELMHVLIDGRPDALEAFCEARDWGTDSNPMGNGPSDDRPTIATASLRSSHGPEEDLATAMALYSYANTPEAPSQYSYYLNTMFSFQMTFVQTQWQLEDGSITANQPVDDTLPICHNGDCPAT